MTFNNISIPSSGTYSIAYRVASQSGGGNIQLEQAGGGAVYGSIAVPSTGGWQTWTTIYQNVTLSAGTQNFGIKALTGGWNINWWAITPTGGSRTSEPIYEATFEATSAYPNPFTKSVAIPIDWDGETDFRVNIFNVSGSLIRTLNVDHLTDGKRIIWDGATASGSIVPKGVYYYQFQVGGQATSGKVVKE